MSKHFVVIGLGKFGYHVAKGLGEQGVSVIGIDSDEDHIREVNEFIDEAIMLDSTDKHALEEAGVKDVDVAVVSIGENIEASILTVMALKDLGVKTVIAKASTIVHGQILSKIGATNVIYPEKQVARKLVKTLVDKVNRETIDLSLTMKIVKLTIPKEWIGKAANSTIFEEKYEMKPIAYKHQGVWHTKFENDDILEENDIIVLLGNTYQIDKLRKDV